MICSILPKIRSSKQLTSMLAVLCAAAMFAGCGSDSDDNNGDPVADVGTDSGTDAGDDAGDDAGSDTGDTGSDDPCDNAEPLTGTISTDTTLDGCYIVSDVVTIEGGKTTVTAGSTLQFEDNAGLMVEGDGRMSAVGTADNPILFTGTQQNAGWWKGILFRDTDNSENVLDHTVVEYGGGSSFQYSELQGNVMLEKRATTPARAIIRNSELRHSAAAGLAVGLSTTLTFESNTLTQNAVPAEVTVLQVSALDADSSYTGNDDDRIIVNNHQYEGDQTWANLGVPFVITETIGIQDNLTLSAGVELQFEADTGLSMGDQGRLGTLTADGTAEEPILLTGTDQIAGWWKGLLFYKSDSVQNRLSHTTVEYGGGAFHDRADDLKGNVIVNGTADDTSVSLSDATIRHSGAWGIILTDHSATVTCNGVTFSDNASGDVAPDTVTCQ